MKSISVDVWRRKISRNYSLLHEKLIDMNVEKNKTKKENQ